MSDMIANWFSDCWLPLLVMSVAIVFAIYNFRDIYFLLDGIFNSDNFSYCHQCSKSVSFERHTKELPEEYEVCDRCEAHVCNECVAWDYFRKVQEEIICLKCAALDILNSYEYEKCPDCGEDIPKDVVDMQGCKNCDHVFTYDYPEGENY